MCFPKAPKPEKPPPPPQVSKLNVDALRNRQQRAASGFGSQQTQSGAGSLPGAQTFSPRGTTILGSG